LIYFAVGLLHGLFGSEDSTGSSRERATVGGGGRLLRLRDSIFATVAFPIGMFVGLVFWVRF
jgi:hypothetical protein